MLDMWDRKLSHTKKGEQARLLDMLAASAPALKSAPSGATFGAHGRKTHTRSRQS
jgi:hypothetical protein